MFLIENIIITYEKNLLKFRETLPKNQATIENRKNRNLTFSISPKNKLTISCKKNSSFMTFGIYRHLSISPSEKIKALFSVKILSFSRNKACINFINAILVGGGFNPKNPEMMREK
jgi:hypothetical protein